MSRQPHSRPHSRGPDVVRPSGRRIVSWTLFGAVFVLASWGLAALGDAWPGSLGALHRQNPAYLLIDLVPLGLFFMARSSSAGRGGTLLASPAASPVAAGAATWVDRGPSAGSARYRVLVTDDNAVNRRVATLILRKAGHQVVEAADGREAVQRILESPFDLVLMDVQMPIMDGFEATRAIRSREDGTRRLPIVAMTGQAMAGDAQACVEAGMDGYVSKPVKSITLLAAVESWAGRRDAPPRKDLADTEAPIDAATLHELRTYGGDSPEDILHELTVMFLEGATKHLAGMREAIGRHDAAALEQVAHTLKGSSATLGARRLADLCHTLENDARQGHVPPDDRVLERVRAEIEIVREYMSREVGLPV